MIKKYLWFMVLAPLLAVGQNINFTDTNFKTALIGGGGYISARNQAGEVISVDANSDGEIQQSEALAVYDINVSRLNTSWQYYTSLGGIEHFSNLRKLSMAGHHITQLDATALLHLQELNCAENHLTNLNVAGLSGLKLLICNNNQLSALNLTGVTTLEDLRASSNNIGTIDLSVTPLLRNAEVSSNSLTSINLSNLLLLKELYCNTNDLTTLDVTGLSSLETLYCGENNLNTLVYDVLPSLKTLSCFGNHLTTFNISGLPALTYLAASANPFGTLDLSAENALVTLYCDYALLTSLDLSGCHNLAILQCNNNELTILDTSANPNLYNIQAIYNQLEYINLKNGSPNNLYLSIYFNPDLRYVCVDEFELTAVQNIVYNNQNVNCVVNTYCSFVPGGDYYPATGQISYDAAGNGCTSNAVPVPQMALIASNETETGLFTSESSGYYSIPLQNGTHTLTPVIPNPAYFSVSPQSITITVANEEITPQNFCLTPLGTFNDIEITLVPTSPARPGFDASYRIIYTNKGTTLLNGQVTFAFNGLFMHYVSAVPVPVLAEQSLLTWDYAGLAPFETRYIDLVININPPVEMYPVNIGDDLGFTAIAYPLDTDASPYDNRSELKQEVVGSNDPNDKTCLEGERISPEMAGEYVHYLIRFENTGNYAAENIVVKDIINTNKFEINTLVPLHSSHPYVTRLNANKVEFIFEGIQLPGMPDDNRHGYIVFKIKTKETLQQDDTFSNTASIYFDHNAPVVTNTALTVLSDIVMGGKSFDAVITLYPNPASHLLYLRPGEGMTLTSLEVVNTLGQVVITLPNAKDEEAIDISPLAPGTYFVKAVTDKGIAFAKFIRQ